MFSIFTAFCLFFGFYEVPTVTVDECTATVDSRTGKIPFPPYCYPDGPVPMPPVFP